MRKITIVLLASAFAVQAGAVYINRVDENGDVIDGPVFFSTYDRDSYNSCRVSDLGYVYFSDRTRINCFDTDLSLISTEYLASSRACLGIDNVKSKVISEDTISIFSPTLVLEDQFEVLAYVDFMTVDDHEGTVWYTKLGEPDGQGLYKCNMTGNPIYYFAETNEATLSSVNPGGLFWSLIWGAGSQSGLNYRDRNGDILTSLEPGSFDGATDMEMYFSDGSLWTCRRSTSAVNKIDSSGNIVYRNTTDFDRPYAIDVNQNDGSVWIADTYNYQLVHLDANGGELLRKDWDYVLVEVAVDQSDNTLIVVDDNIAVEITPSSLGRIKAGFAEEYDDVPEISTTPDIFWYNPFYIPERR
jgi:hypothetical protein